MFAIAFGVGTVFSLVTGGQPDLYTTAYFLVLAYAVMRWGSGRAMIGGGAMLLAGILLTLVTEAPTVGDIIGAFAVVISVSTLGIAFRWRAGSRARELERARLLERERLARDLHDTVAHHVSAIAIQAQAGTAVADQDPAAAAAVLRVIEGEASRTLDEMRSMVRILRNDEDAAERAPTAGIDDVRRLASVDGSARVDVQVRGDAGTIEPAMGTAVFRIAQEAVTNARRHALNATRVDVRVEITAGEVRLEVHDNGQGAASVNAGYGVPGMIERAALLGGTCTAGPVTTGGWTVSAVLPRSGEPA